MIRWLRRQVRQAYLRHLDRAVDDGPTHVAIIQDGNRRYARKQGNDAPDGHREGAQTTEQVLHWCQELGIEELTLYAFSTENFERDERELAALFELIERKFTEVADAERIHENEVCIRALGDVSRLPESVQAAVRHAEERTAAYDRFHLNVALAYGGRDALLASARNVCAEVAAGTVDPADIGVDSISSRLYRQSVRDVDLIIRTGGDERTSNFLPWHANGNEAAVVFCAPYWPEFSKVDFLRAIRTYESREQSWQQTRAERAVALVRAVAETELSEARGVAHRLRDQLSSSGAREVSAELERQHEGRPVD
jgi:tritrans,polycis-undecaprenyl-diphosphate synthase [geranylgeranyl-diphosphate specific]